MANPSAPRRLTIATRESALALWQAEHIRALLAALYPSSDVALLGMTTEGDRVLDQPLADIGGKASSSRNSKWRWPTVAPISQSIR